MSRRRLSAVLIASTRPEELALFYGRGFDLGEPRAEGDLLGFSLENGYLGIERAKEEPGPDPGTISLWFPVEDAQAAYDRLLGLGATPREPPFPCSPDEILATVLDPEGHVVGLIQAT